MLIFIIGYMGSGKSTFGKKLAGKLGYEFVDMDAFFIKENQATILEFFTKEGEDVFRKKEQEVLQRLLTKENAVIATGGGTPFFFDNMALMNRRGITVYLKLHPESLFHRLRNSKTVRPLLKDLQDKELLEKINDDLAEREPFYQQAKYTVNGETPDIEEVLSYLK